MAKLAKANRIKNVEIMRKYVYTQVLAEFAHSRCREPETSSFERKAAQPMGVEVRQSRSRVRSYRN